MQYGTITKGRHTSGHGSTLESLGYEVEDLGYAWQVKASKIVGNSELVDIKDNTDQIKTMIKEKMLMSYSTQIRFPSGRVLYGVKACQALEEIAAGLSALIVKPFESRRDSSKQAKGPSLSQFLSNKE